MSKQLEQESRLDRESGETINQEMLKKKQLEIKVMEKGQLSIEGVEEEIIKKIKK